MFYTLSQLDLLGLVLPIIYGFAAIGIITFVVFRYVIGVKGKSKQL